MGQQLGFNARTGFQRQNGLFEPQLRSGTGQLNMHHVDTVVASHRLYEPQLQKLVDQYTNVSPRSMSLLLRLLRNGRGVMVLHYFPDLAQMPQGQAFADLMAEYDLKELFPSGRRNARDIVNEFQAHLSTLHPETYRSELHKIKSLLERIVPASVWKQLETWTIADCAEHKIDNVWDAAERLARAQLAGAKLNPDQFLSPQTLQERCYQGFYRGEWRGSLTRINEQTELGKLRRRYVHLILMFAQERDIPYICREVARMEAEAALLEAVTRNK